MTINTNSNNNTINNPIILMMTNSEPEFPELVKETTKLNKTEEDKSKNNNRKKVSSIKFWEPLDVLREMIINLRMEI